MNSRHALPECTCPPGDPQTDCPVVRFMTAAPEPETRTGEPGGELKCVCGGPGDRDHDCPALNTTIAEAKVAAPAAPAVERVEAWLVEVQSAGEWLRDCVVLTEPYRANGMYADGHYRFIPLVRAPTNTGEPSDG